MKRLLKTTAVLSVALLLVASAVNAALEGMGRASVEDRFTWYDDNGVAVVTYEGPQALTQKVPHPVRPAAAFILHRTSGSVASTRSLSTCRERVF